MTEVIHILLVEDDEDDYCLTSDYLAQCKSPTFELTWVTNSKDAVDVLKKENFDLCLLDYLLGAENAIDVLNVLKSNQFSLPVVILTGQTDATVDELVMRAGAADYLQKAEIGTPRFMRTIRYALVRRDIENERLERDKVEQKNRAKDKFLAHLGHELRTPLTSILGYTELLIDDTRSHPFQQELSIIHSNGKHLLSLLNDLLDMSRIMANKLELNIKDVNLSAFLTDIHSLMRLNAKDKGLSLHVISETKIPEFIKTDPTRLRQVLLNLISNAVKFTDKGSITLSITLTNSTNKNKPSSLLSFSVEDTGIGMPPDKLENIFQPFEQIEDVMRANHSGAGLGLAICKELVMKLGGDIQVRSRLGDGSCFTFSIDPGNLQTQPLINLALGEIQPVKSGSIQLNLTGKVLIVDDLREIRRLTGHIVGHSNADISYAENGVKALEAVLEADEHNHPFDLVLMDIHMPVMNGIEALHAIRRHGKGIPVIAVTAASRKGLEASLIKEGFNDVIGKPIDRFALANLLTRYLPSDNPSTFDDLHTHVGDLPIKTDHALGQNSNTHEKKSTLSPPLCTKASSHKESPSIGKQHILVIEDDDDAAAFLKLLVTLLGHQVTTHGCGSAALNAAQECPFDHVLMDLTLPDYDGYDLARKLREVLPSATLTIVSGHEADKDAMAAIGIQNALLKPITRDDVTNVIERHAAR